MLYGLLVDLVPHGDVINERRVEWMNGPMREGWAMDGLFTHADWQRRLEGWINDPESQAENIRFGLLTKDGTPIGTFSLVNVDLTNRTAEVGAGIGDPAYWGGGYGSDAMLLIVEYAFRWLDLRRLWLTTMGTNTRAQRQVEKCGFAYEGARRNKIYFNNQYVDHLYYGLMREEWPGRDVMVERLGLREKALARP
jgi:RimJ/RimL family protein N-acetyltransferase